jgi:hypothetical protein
MLARPNRVRSRALPKPRASALSAVAPAEAREMGYLTINAVPWGAVQIDGKRVSDETPIYRFPVAAGEHRVTVSGNPARPHPSPARVVVVKPGETQKVSINW